MTFSFEIRDADRVHKEGAVPYLPQVHSWGALCASSTGGSFAACCGSAIFFKGDEAYYKQHNAGIQLLFSDEEVKFRNTKNAHYDCIKTQHGFINVKFNVGGVEGDYSWAYDEDDSDECSLFLSNTRRNMYTANKSNMYTKAEKESLVNQKIFGVHLGTCASLSQTSVNSYHKLGISEEQIAWYSDTERKTMEMFSPGEILLFVTVCDVPRYLNILQKMTDLGNLKEIYTQEDYCWNGNYPASAGYTPRLKLHVMEKGE